MVSSSAQSGRVKQVLVPGSSWTGTHRGHMQRSRKSGEFRIQFLPQGDATEVPELENRARNSRFKQVRRVRACVRGKKKKNNNRNLM